MKPEGPAAVNTAVIMRDPDGYPLEFAMQDTPEISSAVPSTSNVVSGWATFIVGDVAASIEFYRTRLGFEPATELRDRWRRSCWRSKAPRARPAA